jgi:molecular chaperone DnaK
MAGAVVGIDLGTTNTVVAVVRGGKAIVLADETGARLLPSVVSFHPSGEVLVGRPARERRLIDARNTIYSVKRLIGRSWQSEEVSRARHRFPFELREGPTHGPLVVARGESYTLPEISALVLRRAKVIAEAALGEPVERAVVTVPASFNDLQRASTKVAAREAGLEVLRILNEPTAAALAYGFGKSGSEKIAVYDFGGGTFDLTLLDLSGNVFEVLATAGDSFLGGDDVDLAIADRIALDVIQRTRFDPRTDADVRERLRAGAEQLKVALSTLSPDESASIDLRELGHGPGGAPIDVRFTMNRAELERIVGPLVDRTFTVCREAFQLARLKESDFDNVILVGGSTRIPLVRQRVEEVFGRKAMDRVNPEEVVAIGAAIQAAALTGAERRRQATPTPLLDPGAVKTSRIEALGGGSKPPERRTPVGSPPRTTGRLITPPLRDPSMPPLPGGKPSTLPGQVPPQDPPAGYPSIPGAVMPRAGATAPLVPPSQPIELGLPPTALPRGFPDRTPEPISIAKTEPAMPKVSAERLRTQVGIAPSFAPATAPISAPPLAPPPRTGMPGSIPPLPPLGPATTQVTNAPSAPRIAPVPTAPSLPTPLPPAGRVASIPPITEAALASTPLLIDVTPLSLAVETVGGYVDKVISRNTPVPCSQARKFTTSTDDQQTVVLRVCQGEGDRFVGNTALGTLELSGLRAARRGEVVIEVTFELDADGILSVHARDLETRRETRAQMRLIGLDPSA